MDALETFPILQWLFVILMGLAFGSFTTVLATRGTFMSLKDTARSACLHCKNVLGLRDLFPLFSWLFLKGQCRHCGKTIPLTYPLIELAVLLLGLVYFILYGFTPIGKLVLFFIAISALTALFVYDLRHKILPNNLMVLLAGAGVFYRFWPGYTESYSAQIVEYGAGALIYGALVLVLSVVMEKILKKKALGMGDVKFFAVAGLWLGLSNLGTFCIIGGVLGVILGVLWQKIRKEALFPFGPALITSFLIVFLLGSSHLL